MLEKEEALPGMILAKAFRLPCCHMHMRPCMCSIGDHNGSSAMWDARACVPMLVAMLACTRRRPAVPHVHAATGVACVRRLRPIL